MSKPDLGRIIAQTMAPPAEVRTIETITGDILEAKRQGGEAILTIGRCLIEAKDMLSHGEWLPWLSDQVEFSERTAQKFMRLAREWSNPSTLADLGASKALMLLALPEGEREQFVEDHNVIDMSARQLEQAIRDRDEARQAAEAAKADAAAAEQARAKMEEDMKLLNVRLSGAQEDREQAAQAVARLEAQLAELKEQPVEVAVETVVDQAAIDKAREEAQVAVSIMQAKLDKARYEKERAEARQKNAEEALEQVRLQLEEQARAEKKAALGADKDVAQFEVLFDQGKFFLPQLMASAEAARVGFDTIKRLMPAGEIADKGKICVATVKGDIHDIGKNIVKMLLDNYGYTVFDLGRDVDPQEVLKTVQERDIKLVGLSALMTTTVVAMEETIKLLHAEVPGVKIIVGGAVLTPEYAKQIGADYYAKDAAESARIAEEVFGQ